MMMLLATKIKLKAIKGVVNSEMSIESVNIGLEVIRTRARAISTIVQRQRTIPKTAAHCLFPKSVPLYQILL